MAQFLFDLDDRLNNVSENFEKENKPYADAQKYIEAVVMMREDTKGKIVSKFTAQGVRMFQRLGFFRGKLISVRATKGTKDAVLIAVESAKTLGLRNKAGSVSASRGEILHQRMNPSGTEQSQRSDFKPPRGAILRSSRSRA